MSPEYAAGFIDGEGSIGIYLARTTWCPRVQVAGTFENVLLLFRERYGGGNVRPKKSEHYHSPQWQWAVANKGGIEYMLEDILPHLIIKYDEAVVMLGAVRGEMDMALAATELKLLKHRF